MPRERPTSVLVIAVFHFLFGGLGLICNLCGIGSQLAGGGSGAMFQTDPRQAKLQRDLEKTMEAKTPWNKTVQLINSAISLGFALLLIIGGLGLVQMVTWGRTLSLLYGWAALAEKLAMGLYIIMVALPAMTGTMEGMPVGTQSAQDRQIMDVIVKIAFISGTVGAIIPLIYPLVVLLVMNTATVKNAFLAPPSDYDRDRALDADLAPGNPYRSGPDDRFKA